MGHASKPYVHSLVLGLIIIINATINITCILADTPAPAEEEQSATATTSSGNNDHTPGNLHNTIVYVCIYYVQHQYFHKNTQTHTHTHTLLGISLLCGVTSRQPKCIHSKSVMFPLFEENGIDFKNIYEERSINNEEWRAGSE